TASFGQASVLFACTSTSSTHGGFLHWTLTVSSFWSPTWSQSLVATARTTNGTCWPAVHCGIRTSCVKFCVTPAATTPLNAWTPATVTTIVSLSIEQFFTVPEIVIASP